MMRKRAALTMAGLVFAACPAAPEEARRPPVESPGEDSPGCRRLGTLAQRVRRGHVRGLSPDINLIPREPNYVGTAAAPVHSGPWDYLARVPLLIHGPGRVEAGRYQGPVTMADVAPTTAALIGFPGFDAPDGRVLREALSVSADVPRLVVTVVWDGGGWNVLDEHANAHPFFDRLTKGSAMFEDMEIGSSPSVTPPIHTTLSTGAFPREHGIPGLRVRTGGEYVDPFVGLDPSRIRVDTLADVYDKAHRNRPTIAMLAAVNWHLGMVGQGAGRAGGDRDIAVLFDDEGVTYSNPELYALPDVGDPAALLRIADRLDARDGKRDGLWFDHDLSDPRVRYASPAHVIYQQRLLEELIVSQDLGRGSVPNLLYVNFKSLDDAGHNWGMRSKEVAATLAATDAALRSLVRTLDRVVQNESWVLILTADHGQTPYPRESGAWPIGGGELARDANAALDQDGDKIEVVDRVSSPGAYVNRSELADNGLKLNDVARWIASYTVEQNLKDDAALPPRFEGREDEVLFDGVLVGAGPLITEAC